MSICLAFVIIVWVWEGEENRFCQGRAWDRWVGEAENIEEAVGKHQQFTRRNGGDIHEFSTAEEESEGITQPPIKSSEAPDSLRPRLGYLAPYRRKKLHTDVFTSLQARKSRCRPLWSSSRQEGRRHQAARRRDQGATLPPRRCCWH